MYSKCDIHASNFCWKTEHGHKYTHHTVTDLHKFVHLIVDVSIHTCASHVWYTESCGLTCVHIDKYIRAYLYLMQNCTGMIRLKAHKYTHAHGPSTCACRHIVSRYLTIGSRQTWCKYAQGIPPCPRVPACLNRLLSLCTCLRDTCSSLQVCAHVCVRHTPRASHLSLCVHERADISHISYTNACL